MPIIIDFNHPYEPPEIMVANAEWDHDPDQRTRHAAEPIKDMNDIIRIRNYLIEKKRYRDNLLFIAGVNFGLRCGDLTQLTYGHLVDRYGHLKDEVLLQEEKTDKYRSVYMNQAVAEALKLYIGDKPVDLNDYIFRSESSNDSDAYYQAIAQKDRTPTDKAPEEKYRIRSGAGGPISVRSINRILKELINDKMKLDIHASTHTLRKTFAYQTIMTAPDRERAIEFLQRLLGHSSQQITLRYAGITEDEMRKHYQNLNLGYSGLDFVRSSRLIRGYNENNLRRRA